MNLICSVWQSVLECASQPCLNHGKCNDVQGGYKCQCKAGFMGHRCEIADHESQIVCDVCGPYGLCVDPIGNTCVCKPEYPGNVVNEITKFPLNMCYK